MLNRLKLLKITLRIIGLNLVKLLLISLICVIAQMSYIAFGLNMANAMTAITIVISIGLVWFSRKSQQEGWIS